MIDAWERIGAVALKEFAHVFKHPPTVAMLILLPSVQLLIFGYAIKAVVDHIPTVVLDESQTPDSRALVAALENSSYFTIVANVGTYQQAVAAIDGDRAKVGLVIPADFGDRAIRGELALAQLLIDGSDPGSSQAALFAAGSIAQVHSSDLAATAMARLGRGGPPPGLELRPVVLYNPSLESIRFLLPGLVGLILQQLALSSTAQAIILEREWGTLEQLRITPLRPMELMFGKCIPYAILSLAAATLTMLAAWLVFGTEVAGSVPLLFVLSFLFLLGSLGAGLFISTVASTELEARQYNDLFLLPSYLLTGFLFPREGMPVIAQQISSLLPLTHYLKVSRGIMLKGVDIDVLWPATVPLLIFAVIVFAGAAYRLSRQRE
ncbi:MAG: ABC transporter permease [Chloroflexi bacterium]|nr:ABC transporter permease [Chloroflexota bacterium]